MKSIYLNELDVTLHVIREGGYMQKGNYGEVATFDVSEDLFDAMCETLDHYFKDPHDSTPGMYQLGYTVDGKEQSVSFEESPKALNSVVKELERMVTQHYPSDIQVIDPQRRFLNVGL